jgi:hypothetical protein
MARIHEGTVELIAGEGTCKLTATRGGDEGRVLAEFYPQHTGNAPGMLFRVMLGWQDATKLAVALKATAEAIRAGVDVVPGTAAAPVMVYFPPFGNFGPGLRLVLTAEDAERLMHGVIKATEFATQAPGIDVVRRLR